MMAERMSQRGKMAGRNKANAKVREAGGISRMCSCVHFIRSRATFSRKKAEEMIRRRQKPSQPSSFFPGRI